MFEVLLIFVPVAVMAIHAKWLHDHHPFTPDSNFYHLNTNNFTMVKITVKVPATYIRISLKI